MSGGGACVLRAPAGTRPLSGQPLTLPGKPLTLPARAQRTPIRRQPLTTTNAAWNRDQVIQAIRDDAPVLRSREALADDKFRYESPAKPEYGDGPAAYLTYSMYVTDTLPKRLPNFKREVLRSFQPDPNTVLVRWRATWRAGLSVEDDVREDDGDKTPKAEVEGATTYRLVDDLVASIEETWEFKGKRESTDMAVETFRFAYAHRTLNNSSYTSFIDSCKLAIWETLKDSPMYGGQMVREELDALTEQMFYAACGLSFSMSVALLVILSKLAQLVSG